LRRGAARLDSTPGGLTVKRKHLVAATLLIWAAAPLCAQTIKEGIEAWQRGNYAAAVGIWTPLAEQGDADAEFNLGQAFRLGRGVQTNLATAKSWFEKAADQGHVDAQTTLGLLLFENSDQAEGLKWLKKAAAQGDPRALLVYGTALVNGDSITQDPPLGYAYINRAAAQGLTTAKETLEQLDHILPAADRKRGLVLARQLAKGVPTTRLARAKTGSKRVEIASAKPIQTEAPKSAPETEAASAPGGNVRSGRVTATRSVEVADAKPPEKSAANSPPAQKTATAPGANAGPGKTAATRSVELAEAKPVERPAAKPLPPVKTETAPRENTAAKTASHPVETASAKPVDKQAAKSTQQTAVAAASVANTPVSRVAATRSAPLPSGAWRVQLGAFSQKGNAEALYKRLSDKPALAGLSAFYIPVGPITRLQVGPFESKSSAQGACRVLGIACFVVAAK
jgi:TPR repeat protein